MITKRLLSVLLLILTTSLNVVEAQGQELPISDTQKSGCMAYVRGTEGWNEDVPTPTIILTKEGCILSVEVQNFICNCATFDFTVKSSISEGSDGSPCSLNISVAPVLGEEVVDCLCPFNVSFTIHDLEPNSFYLDCWWYKGLVELKEGEPLVLADVYEDATIDGMNFTLRKAFHYAMLTKSEWVGEVRIPSEVSYEGQTYSVTSIYNDAFTDNTTLTKVYIPRTIKNMDFSEVSGFQRNLFARCSALESIEVEEGNPVLCTVDGVLFNKEKTRLYSYPAADSRTSYTVPEGVTWIDGSAFATNHHLVSISLPDDVTSLGASAFYDCTNLEEVNMPSGLKTLAGYMFWNCQHLKSITIPKGVTHLGGNLFNGCTSLTSVTMPESVTTTDYSVFENCKSLKYVTLSPNLDQINHNMFLNCSSLTEIQIPRGVTSVMSNAFKGCKALKTLDLPESVTRLGDYVFSGCILKTLYIRGVIDFRFTNHYWLFNGMGTETEVYVQPSQVDQFQAIYKGSVYPLSEQTNGRKMLEQGKTWVYDYHHFEENEEEPPTETVYPVRYTIIGDTVIDNKSYYKMYQEIDNQKTYYAAYREEGLKVFVRYTHYDEDIIVADFEYKGLYDPNGYGYEEYDPYSAIKEYIDYIEVDGTQYKRHTYYENDKNNKLVIGVEGIGYTGYGLMYPSIYGPQPDCICDFKVFSSCEVNGKCIFTADDFYVQTTTNPVDDIAYRPFVEEGKVWKVGSTAGISDGIVKMVDYYYFDGDTIIDGKTCKQMMCQRYVNPNHPDYDLISRDPLLGYSGAWYEEGKKVYFYDTTNKQFWMMYDFSLETNEPLDFLQSQMEGCPPLMIGPKQTGGLKGFKGVYRDIVMCVDEGQNIHSTFWLEGVGDINGPTRYPFDPILEDPVPEFLMSCVVGDEVIYLNDEFEDGATPEGVRKKRFDFTHTIKTKPKARIRRGEAQSLYGEYNDQQLGINLDPLDDAYQVSITDESDKVVYEKIVNAGSIVALNIDISAYAKGLYTVTVENNSESFTGEFETETTGIDVDGDGILTAKDITAVVNVIAGKITDEAIMSAADVNGDGVANVADIIKIANEIIGK